MEDMKMAFAEGAKRKVLVTGLGRGGTSSISSMLAHSGFYVSASPNETFEDDSLRRLLLDDKLDALESELKSRTDRFPLVAWKDPKLYGKHGIDLVRRLPDDWIVIVIFRDPVAIVSRRMATDQVSFTDDLPHVAHHMRKLHEFASEVAKTKRVVYVSYEKVMTEPIASICAVFEMLGLPMSVEDAQGIWGRMRRSQKKYLKRIERAVNEKAAPLAENS